MRIRIAYRDSVGDVRPDDLRGSFVGWPNPPERAMHLRLRQGSDEVVLAVDEETSRVGGDITAITDGVYAGFATVRRSGSEPSLSSLTRGGLLVN